MCADVVRRALRLRTSRTDRAGLNAGSLNAAVANSIAENAAKEVRRFLSLFRKKLRDVLLDPVTSSFSTWFYVNLTLGWLSVGTQLRLPPLQILILVFARS